MIKQLDLRPTPKKEVAIGMTGGLFHGQCTGVLGLPKLRMGCSVGKGSGGGGWARG